MVMACGLVPVLGGQPLGGGSFISIMVSAAAIGAVVQYALAQREKPKQATAKDDDRLLDK